jgi:hypothetical protein
MREQRLERLVGYCHERAGDGLRTVTAYDRDGFEVVYIRDDLANRYSRERFEQFVTPAREAHATLEPLHTADELPLGSHAATIHAFENAVVLQLVEADGRGCLVSFESGVGSTVSEFIGECRHRLVPEESEG